MEDRVVIKGEMKGSKFYFRAEKSEKSKIDCVSLLLKTIKIKRKSKK